MSSEYFKKVQPTYIEAWPKELCSKSIAQVDVPLTLEEAENLGSHIAEFGEAFKRTGDLTIINNRVNLAVASFPEGSMVRLGSRSPKDSWLALRCESMRISFAQIITRETAPLRFILDCSERMYEDLTLAIQNNYCPHIFVRQWIDIPRWSELRCFMRNRKLVGISQYYYHDPLPELIDDEIREGMDWAVRKFFDDFVKVCHLDDVVFDVYVKLRKRGCHREWEVRLIEINPFFEMTDPCLFDWRDDGKDFDGSFRFMPF